MLLNYVGPVSLLLHPESPQGSQSGAAAVADGLRATSSFVYWYASGTFWPQPPGINIGLSETTLEKEMATHSSTLAWRIPWREEPGRLQSMGSQIVGHDWAISFHFTSLHFKWNKGTGKAFPSPSFCWVSPFPQPGSLAPSGRLYLSRTPNGIQLGASGPRLCFQLHTLPFFCPHHSPEPQFLLRMKLRMSQTDKPTSCLAGPWPFLVAQYVNICRESLHYEQSFPTSISVCS